MHSPPTASEIRRRFVDFFVERGHREVPSMPVFPPDDPTLLFTNAGMNQFKDVFLGTGRRSYARAVNSQKCIRVSGKHNDLEEVGRDTYHHTFFEMLGNWSFGDYFKEEAISWAWELLTEVWKLPKDRLWVTVFAGDEKDGLPADLEAERIWRERTDVDPSHVLRFSRRDNFWEMGETGPCGPCTEIHLDRGEPGRDPADCDPRDGAVPSIGVNAGNERFIELWNLVFIEFNRFGDGSLKRLPAQHVDTGMGLERIVAVLQGKRSNYETDLFAPLFGSLERMTGLRYGAAGPDVDVAFRVCSDHVRGVASALADGALPSNTGRGYVLRRLIRRAARYGRQSLGMQDPFLFELVPAVGEALGDAYPELTERLEHVRLLVEEEEKSFGRTLGRGLVRFAKLADEVESRGARQLPGEEVYDLYATYGFPQDLVELMARERGLELDLEGWRKAEEAHQDASRSEGRFKQLLSAEQLADLPPTERTYHAEGDDAHTLATEVVALFPGAGPGDLLILRRSPFYPEGGGQTGDTGAVEAPDGTFRFEVRDTRLVGEVVVHVGAAEGKPSAGLPVAARVDQERRERTRRYHTATHLLHGVLRSVLGEHVTQQGSYVGPDRLRFDFSHPRRLTPEEIDQIEREVNERICSNAAVATSVENLADARARGVMALFGEKYDERVRVVTVSDSVELCGGTHVRAAGDIGAFVIANESAIQAGVRRIEALTGAAAIEHVQRQRRNLQESAHLLKVGADELPGRIEHLLAQIKAAKSATKKGTRSDVSAAVDAVRAALSEQDGYLSGVVDLPELDAAALRELSTRAKSIAPDLALVLFGRQAGRVPFLVLCQGRALERGLDAGAIAKLISAHMGGGGGGRPDSAQGQGENAAGMAAAKEAITAQLAGSPT